MTEFARDGQPAHQVALHGLEVGPQAQGPGDHPRNSSRPPDPQRPVLACDDALQLRPAVGRGVGADGRKDAAADGRDDPEDDAGKHLWRRGQAAARSEFLCLTPKSRLGRLLACEAD